MLLLAVTCATLQNTSFKLGDKHLSGMLLISPECYAHAHKTDLEDEAYTVSSIGGGDTRILAGPGACGCCMTRPA